MWTCPKCGGKVGDQFTDVPILRHERRRDHRSCSPTVDTPRWAAAAMGPQFRRTGVATGSGPPPTDPERLLRAAKAGAMYGGLYGAMFVFIMWAGRVTVTRRASSPTAQKPPWARVW